MNFNSYLNIFTVFNYYIKNTKIITNTLIKIDISKFSNNKNIKYWAFFIVYRISL